METVTMKKANENAKALFPGAAQQRTVMQINSNAAIMVRDTDAAWHCLSTGLRLSLSFDSQNTFNFPPPLCIYNFQGNWEEIHRSKSFNKGQFIDLHRVPF